MRTATDHSDIILQTAAKLFARKPFHEVLMDDVAESAGIAKGTIYRYFPNKEELFGALSMRYMEMLAEGIRVVAAQDKPPLKRLEAMLVRMIELIDENNDFFQVMQRHECNLWAQRECDYTQRRNVIRDHFVGVIKEACASRELSCPFNARHAADMLLGMIRNLWRFSVPRPSAKEMAAMAMHIFVKGLKPARGGAA